jgi:hypothetical protein
MSLQGSQKLAILLCKFSDTENTEPQAASFYKELFSDRGTGGLNDYWIAASLGAINLDGSQVFGWKTLDIKRADFLAAHPGRWDKIKGAIDGFIDVDTSKFTAVVAMFNVNVTDGGSDGGVLGQPGDENVTFLAHETGHIFGLEHSFDHSTRKAATWSAEGEYYDSYDIMSAMNGSDTGHRFSPRGPLLNAPNIDRMGWLPANRVWQPMGTNSSSTYEVDIVALEHPEVDGFLAAKVGGVIAEFRLADGWDAGLARPAVLLHQPANPNSYIIASNSENNVNEWQPGQIYGPSALAFAIEGGRRITVVSFNLQKKTARIRVQVKAARKFVEGPGRIFGGVAAGGDGILILPNGKIIRIPPHSPILILAEQSAFLQSQWEALVTSELTPGISAVQTSRIRGVQTAGLPDSPAVDKR